MLRSSQSLAPQSPLPVHFLPWQRFLFPLLMAALALTTLLSAANTWRKVTAATGEYDLHPYWYFGEYVRAGINPYLAYAEELPLTTELHYVDGSIVQLDSKEHQELGHVVANTAPMLLLLSFLSYFSWFPAKIIWLLCNLVLLATIPWLTMRLLPVAMRLPAQFQWLAALSFYAMKGPREDAAVGQTTPLVLFLMIMSLLLRENYWFWAGLSLGLALGKYSVALPVCLFMLLEKRWRVLLVAALVQLCGLVAVALLDNGGTANSLWDASIATVNVYWRMVIRHSRLEGIHLQFALRDYPNVAIALVALISVVTVGIVVYRRWQGWQALDVLPANSALALWLLVSVYHRNYDSVVVILALVFLLSVIAFWHLAANRKKLLGLFYVLAVGVLCLPGDILESFVTPEQYILLRIIIDRSITVVVIALLGVVLWLLLQRPRLAPQQESAAPLITSS